MLNKVILIGRTTRDVDFRRTSSGKPVAMFTLALDNRYVLKDGNPTTDFINCIAWDKTAETMDTYVKKGSLIAVTGRIQTRNYENKDGIKVYVTEVVCENMVMLDKKKETTTEVTTDFNITDEDLPF